MYAIFVTINVRPEYLDPFTEASFGDAQGSVRDEPGCFRFDIMRDESDATRFYLYEVYRDKEAYEAHMETPHFKRWWETVERMLDGEASSVKMHTVFPSDAGWEKQKPGLLAW